MALTSFDLGKLKIAAHVREELDRVLISADQIQCKSGGLHTRPGVARLIITVGERVVHVDLEDDEVSGCESIVAGEVWYKIAGLIDELRRL